MTVIRIAPGTTAAEVQAAIDAAEGPTTVRLLAGTHRFDAEIVVARDDVFILGQGRGRTTVEQDASLGTTPVFRFGDELHSPRAEANHRLAQKAEAGDEEIWLKGPHGIEAGDTLYLSAENTEAFLDRIGDTEWREDSPLRTMVVQVTAVDGQRIALDSALPFDFSRAITDVEVRTVIEGGGIGNMTIVGPTGPADPAVFENVPEHQGAHMVIVSGAVGTSVKNLRLIDGSSHGLVLDDARELTVDGFEMHGTLNKGPEGNGYGIWLRDVHDSTLQDITVTDTRHAVLFGGWNTATGNEVQVAYTNRDVNFHGGRDQGNSVVIDWIDRDETEQHYLSRAAWTNTEGTHYGAPTDIEANEILIRRVSASNKDELIVAHPDGARIDAVEGDDTVHTGRGGDRVRLGDGDDVVHASRGRDVLIGGAGEDIAVFDGAFADHRAFRDGEATILKFAGGIAWLADIEAVRFEDGLVTLSQLNAGATAWRGPLADGSGLARWDGAEADLADAIASATILDGRGNSMLSGKRRDDVIAAGAGADKVMGRAGDDSLWGEGGRDRIEGGRGDDLISGGAGRDRLVGGQGADLFFYASGDGRDVIEDFSGADAILIDVTGIDSVWDLDGLASGRRAGVVIDFGDGDRLIVRGLDADDLSEHLLFA